MNRKFFIILAFFVCCFSVVQAQTIVNELERETQGEGTIKIATDPKITELLGTPSVLDETKENNSMKVSGYRIQVFMGNNHKKSKEEALHRQHIIKDNFPEIGTYVRYEAPNWKVFAGDFIAKEEAEVFKKNMLKIFPELGKEMYIVSDKINVSIHK
jgi:hypothetical protein